MSERFNPRQIVADPDVPSIGAFGGLSSASYQLTGDILYADKLVNAVVTNRNEIKRRRGSRILANINSLPVNTATSVNSYKFTFDNTDYLVAKVGRDLYLYSLTSTLNISQLVIKSNAFLATSTTETASFATVIEDDNCFILCATQSTPLVVGVLLKRSLNNLSITSATQFTGVISYYPSTNLITQVNTFTYEANNYVGVSSLSQSTATLSFTTASAHGLSSSSRVRTHTFFWCRGAAANYYPGSYFANSAVRRNSLPLDVNVELPTEISSTPIIDEYPIQDLSDTPTRVWQQTNLEVFTKVTTRKPTTNLEWDFSDGAYVAGVNNFTTRTPNFISFGALSAGGNVERVYIFRSREILLAKGSQIAATDLGFYIERVASSVNYWTRSIVPTTTDCVFFGIDTNNKPSLSAVCELVYFKDSGTTALVDLTKGTNQSIQINDGYGIPLYGYAYFNNTVNLNYSPLVLSVGNRVVMSGSDNRVLFSNADWSYRGMSWNNFQVSTIAFSATSAYSVALGQQSSKVLGLSSVNGVVIAATDKGIFRISGENPSTPPSASTSNVSRLSNEVVNTSESLLVYESKVFFVSSNGLYQLQYSQETEELTSTPISTQVNDYFKRTPISVSYSPTYRAFVIGLANSSELLVYSFESETFTSFKFSFVPVSLKLGQTLDGYLAVFNQSGSACVSLCVWDNNQSTDLSNASTLLPVDASVVGTSLNVGTTPVDVSSLCTPAELVGLYSSNLVQAYGDNHARSLSGTVNISEHSGGRVPAPILTFVVSKAYMSDKLIRSHRVRAVNLLVAGTGELYSTLVFPNKDTSSRNQQTERTQINLTPGVVKPGVNLNNVNTRIATGDTCNIRLRFTGVNEAWALALQLTQDLLLLGWQLDTSVKKRGRVN